MQDRKRILIVMGSIRAERINTRMAAWASERLVQHGFDVEILDPADAELLPVQIGDEQAIERLNERLSTADGFVIVTPEYNHAEPGPLKTLIDQSSTGWKLRPVGLISYGGLSGGLRAVEALRIVLAELHAVPMRDTISFSSPWRRVDDDGKITDPEHDGAANVAMKVFAHRLDWWVNTLAEARLARPYDPEIK